MIDVVLESKDYVSKWLKYLDASATGASLLRPPPTRRCSGEFIGLSTVETICRSPLEQCS